MNLTSERLRGIRTFPQLVKYLRDELEWPIETSSFDELTFEWSPDELGIERGAAAKVEEIKQLRPLAGNQPWGIFFVRFEPKHLPIVALRRILSQLVLKRRASARAADRQTWKMNDLLFISSHGEGGDREITFAHFNEPSNTGELPTLRVLGWDGSDTDLKLEYVARTLREHLTWPDESESVDAWRERWSSAFVLRNRHSVRTAQELAEQLAALAKAIRAKGEQVLELESASGPLTKLYDTVKAVLIHDLEISGFADMYAQTIVYGLFSAAVTRQGGGGGQGVGLDDLGNRVPLTNPFLRELLSSFVKAGGRGGKIDFDELGVQDVVSLLNSPDTHLGAVLRDFGKLRREDDPVIHFYESFLDAYDRKQKAQRGVFYTPRPVVSFIVRSVHEILQREFGLKDGLASTDTWHDIGLRRPDLRPPQGVAADTPFVQILDPATGTATFLVEVVDLVFQTMTARWVSEGVSASRRRELWNAYVPRDLLTRLHGYEIMMAPYAIAHMKLGLKLLETGYDFTSNERARIYLTNALEPAVDVGAQFAFAVPALAHEASAVSEIKRNSRFTVVIGNPPYATFGQLNRIPHILKLLDDYKRGLNEKKLNLDDDFIKFIRLCQDEISKTGHGVLGVITSNTFFDGITHRQMRRFLSTTFPSISVLDLHGSKIKPENPPQGVDDNVFEIKQGVGVTLAVRTGEVDETVVRHADLWGTASEKYAALASSSWSTADWEPLKLDDKYRFFKPQIDAGHDEYETYMSLRDLMVVGSSAVQTKRDALFVDVNRQMLEKRMSELLKAGPTQAMRSKYPLDPSGGWKPDVLEDSRYSKTLIQTYTYRPFDRRWIYYDDALLGRSRLKVFRHLLRPNLALATLRQTVDDAFRHVFCADGVCDINLLINHHVSDQVFPLYLYEEETSLIGKKGDRSANLAPEFVRAVEKQTALSWTSDGRGDLKNTFGPEDVFAYTYSILHSGVYRARYWQKLKIEFPRIPVPSGEGVFSTMTRLGHDLVQAHLAPESVPIPEGTVWVGAPPYGPIQKVSYESGTIWIDGANGVGITGISEDVWAYRVGTYQVCAKWLADRKKRTLDAREAIEYAHVTAAIGRTIELVDTIDAELEAHGGWPHAFLNGSTTKRAALAP